MMGRLDRDQEQFFYEYRLDDLVPGDHLVRHVDAILDLSWLREELAPYYSHTGRPSVDPELMVRMLLVGYVFAIRSERQLCSEVQVNMAFAHMKRIFKLERYADDIVCHCRSAEAAQALRGALRDRFAACMLELHPEKTKIVYCKDANRRGDYVHTSFDFLGFTFRARKTVWQGRIHAHGFLPAVSRKALKAISRTIRRWMLHLRSDQALEDLAEIANPHIRGWINSFGNFYRTELRPTLKRIDLYVIRWARRKFKRLRRKTKGARDWFDRLRRANPRLFAHWQLCHGNGRTSGAV